MFRTGEKIAGFVVEATKFIPELQLTAVQLRHARTNAQHLHIVRDDANSVFSVAFPTMPIDSTGVPHILEHTTLCGSKKFPVRDPFFKMLNRSMATYMNAWTASDFTMYPFSTENPVDMKHLRDIYTDACFRPLLQKTDFLQEGWRLEYENLSDPKSALAFKGVVYNEMKGAFSDANSLFVERLQQQLLPGTTYSYVSGGDPKHITDLTYEQLVAFHRECYHPTNAKFYTYGKYPAEDHFEFIDQAFREFEPLEKPVQGSMKAKRFTKPVFLETFGPPDPMGDPLKQTKLSVSYLLNDVSDTFETFAMRVLSYLLTDGQASPFYKALIETNIGSDYVASTGYDTTTKDASFSIGLQGIRKEDVPMVEEKIQQVFQESREQGFDPKRIEAAIHQIELGIKHKTANFGMNLSHGIMSAWMHGANPLEWLEVNSKISRLRQEIGKGGFFESLIDKYFLQNPHRLTFAMHASDAFNAELAKEEEQRLKSMVEKLSAQDKQAIFEDGKTLAELQNTKQDISILPTLSLADVLPKAKTYPLEQAPIGSYPTQWRKTATNEITYFRAIASWESLPADLRTYLGLYVTALTSLGTKSMSPGEFDEAIRLHTGGIGASNFLATYYGDLDMLQEGIAVSGNCLDRNAEKMFDLLQSMMTDIDFNQVDKERVKTIILNTASGMMSSLANSGHGFARGWASSTLTPTKSLGEIYGGITQIDFVNRLATSDDMEMVLDAFKRIQKHIQEDTSMRMALTHTDSPNITAKNKQLAGSFINTVGIRPLEVRAAKESSSPIAHKVPFEPNFGTKTWLPMPFATNFAAKAIRTFPMTDPRSMHMQVLCSLMTHHYLHREIREKNGAYGGGAAYSALDGILSFYSYRDPSPLQSVESFQKAAEWASSEKFTQQQLTEAKLSIFSSMDAPRNVSSEGMSYFEHRLTDELRQKRREALFAVTVDEVNRAASWLAQENSQASVAVLASEQQFSSGNTVGTDWRVHAMGSSKG